MQVFPIGWWLGTIAVLLMITNYHLLLGKRIAWKIMCVWYILLTFSIQLVFDSFSFSFDFGYGLDMSISLGINLGAQKLSIDVLSLIMLIIHFSSRKYFRKKTVIDEIDEISGKDININ
ncbi:hypothetical protein [uncultured Kordia sp.]|uniref:hypothetical protein n=1 Tax=uncultured Kordia sp. TaxID=507699 RepID=UPI002603E505|nr:hypothetical protein [uncultured Kordia sp.]